MLSTLIPPKSLVFSRCTHDLSSPSPLLGIWLESYTAGDHFHLHENESHGITETLQVACGRERCLYTEPVVSGRDPNRIERGIDRS